MLKNKRILVTGGAGFIGSNLCKTLSFANEVVSLDNYLVGSIHNHVDGVEYISGDVQNINAVMSGQKYDYIFHLGEYSRVEQSLDDFDTCLDSNSIAFAEFVKYWRYSGAKLVYSGSSTKFANNLDGQLLSPYTMTKANNVRFIEAMSQWYNLDHVIVYFYNVYGENENNSKDYGTVVAKFIESKRRNKRVYITAPGTQRRNFTYIQDTVDGILLAAEHGSGDGYGIGADEDYSIIELANLLNLHYELKAPLASNRRGGDKVENEKIKLLGWSPRTSLRHYLTTINP